MEHRVYHIVAACGDAFSGQGVIGKDNQLPWPKNSGDMKFFKETTIGATVVMGRNTFESIGRPLPNRTNFVLSRSDFKREGITVFHSLSEAVEQAPTEKVFVIGGAEIYKQSIAEVDAIYLTRINGNYPGDAYYPAIPAFFKKNENQSKMLSEKYSLPISFLENAEKHSKVKK